MKNTQEILLPNTYGLGSNAAVPFANERQRAWAGPGSSPASIRSSVSFASATGWKRMATCNI